MGKPTMAILAVLVVGGLLVGAAVITNFLTHTTDIDANAIILWDGQGAEDRTVNVNFTLNGGETWTEDYTIKYVGELASMDVALAWTLEDGITSTIDCGNNSDISSMTLDKDVEYTLTMTHIADKYLKSGSYSIVLVID